MSFLKRLVISSPVWMILGVFLFIFAPPLLSNWIIFLMTVALAKAMVVLGVVMLLRGGLISFGHGLYFAVGAYTVAFAMHQWKISESLLLILLCLLTGGGMGAITGVLLKRYRGIFFAMLTLAFSMILYTLLLKFYAVTGGTDGMAIPPVTVLGNKPSSENLRLFHYYFTLTLTFCVIYFGRRFISSPLGYLIQAVRDNEIRIEYMGASAQRSIYLTFVVSGALGGLGGGLVAFNVEHVAPELAYWTSCADFVFVAVLGGTGNVLAPFLGSIVYEFLKNYAFKLSPETWQMTLGGILLLIIFFLPQGLWSLNEKFKRKWGKWQLSSRP